MASNWSKGLMLYTDEGMRILGLNDRTKKPWTKEEAFRFCNHPLKDEFQNQVRANQLVLKSALVNSNNNKARGWYKDIANFRVINIYTEVARG